MIPRLPDSERALYAAMALVVAGFLGSSVYTQRAAGRIQDSAQQIALDVAPSIEHLAAARAEMHEFEVLVHDYVQGAIPPGDLSRLERSHRRMQRELAAYVALPASSAEGALLEQIQEQMAELRLATDAAVQRVQAGDDEGALTIIRGRLHLAVARAREAIIDDISLHGRVLRGAAARIDGIHTHATWVARVTDGLMVLLALVTTVLAGRVIRRYAEVMRARSAVQEARAAELEQFAGRVAHDVLSPLSPVIPALDVLEDRLDLDDEYDPRAALQLRRARTGLGRVRGLVDELLLFAQAGGQPAARSACRLDAVVDGVLEELSEEAQEAGVELRDEAQEPLAVACGGALASAVVRNLVRNAIKYMGGSDVRRVTLRSLPGPEAVRLEVEDTGPGLPAELSERVFEPYVRGHRPDVPGSGLGLATVKRIVEAHGGLVGVEPAGPGGGCRFWLELPRVSMAAAHGAVAGNGSKRSRPASA